MCTFCGSAHAASFSTSPWSQPCRALCFFLRIQTGVTQYSTSTTCLQAYWAQQGLVVHKVSLAGGAGRRWASRQRGCRFPAAPQRVAPLQATPSPPALPATPLLRLLRLRRPLSWRRSSERATHSTCGATNRPLPSTAAAAALRVRHGRSPPSGASVLLPPPLPPLLRAPPPLPAKPCPPFPRPCHPLPTARASLPTQWGCPSLGETSRRLCATRSESRWQQPRSS